jgi:Outer membrane protein beta-barrel domain
MKKLLILTLLPFYLNGQEKAETEIINPKGNWYFGAEMGTNEVDSPKGYEKNIHLQGGFLAEYYFAKHWSVTGKIKYFKTGFSILGNRGYLGNYYANVISIPINVSWDYRIYKNLSGSLKLGLGFNYLTKEENLLEKRVVLNDTKTYFSVNSGVGFNYFLNKRIAFFITAQNFNLSTKYGEVHYGNPFISLLEGNGGDVLDTYYLDNATTSVGIKYSFKN